MTGLQLTMPSVLFRPVPSKLRLAALLIALSAMSGCGNDVMAPTGEPSLNLTGSWSGNVGAGSGSGRALRVSWTASQAESVVSGPASLTTSPALTDVTIPGTLSAAVHGSQLSLTFSAPAGVVPALPRCTVAASGSAVATGMSISGTLDVVYTSCEQGDLVPPARDTLVLNRQ